MLIKLFFVTLLCLFSIYLPAQGQQRTTTKLNRHFIEIDKNDSENHRYNKVETVSATGETVTWIFDLQNRMVKQSKQGINTEGNFNQEISETFDSTAQLISQRITNMDNTKYMEFHYRNGVKKAEVSHLGVDVFEIWRNNPDSLYTTDHNDFEPGMNKNEWMSHFAKNLTYPMEARRIRAEGSVIVAILVDENGNLKQLEVANEAFVHAALTKEALRVVRLFKGKFTPAINLDGKPEEKWINIPVRFRLS